MTHRSSVGQSRKWSAIESTINIVVGIGISFTANLIVLPLLGLHPSLSQVGWMTVIFTIISFARQFVLRRFFNWLHGKGYGNA